MTMQELADEAVAAAFKALHPHKIYQEQCVATLAAALIGWANDKPDKQIVSIKEEEVK